MHILWINEVAELTGGCERYIADTTNLLKEKYKVTSTLLYGVDGWTDPLFMNYFDHSFPLVSLSRQIKEIEPDIVYVHRLTGKKIMKELLASGKPVIRFFHDHKLFCLREHKYTVRGHKTCTKPIGFRCYPCLGFINRSERWPGLKLSTLHKFKSEQKVNKALTAIVVGSNYMKDHLIAHGFKKDKITVNPLFTISEVKEPSENKRDILLFVGQIIRGKGIDILLKAMKDIKSDAKLVICGSGKQEAEFKQLAVDFNIQDKVEWTGRIPRQELDNYYKRALCFIMPSRVPETFGLTGLEAMGYGTPVVAADVGGISQWLEDGSNGFLVPSNNAEKLAEAVKKIIDNKKLQSTMRENALDTFKEKFKPEFHIDKLYELFNELIRREL